MTDLHLNFLKQKQIDRFIGEIANQHAQGVLIGGDIGEAGSIVPLLDTLSTSLHCPIYFVLGNHDFYHGSIKAVKQAVQELANSRSNLFWLPDSGVVEMSPTTALLGHGGWADGGYGDFWNSTVDLNDYHLIAELTDLPETQRLLKMRELAAQACDHFQHWLPLALQAYDHVYCLTHVPPFAESCWHEGEISDQYHLPHFASKLSGDALRSIMLLYPEKKLTVLCGHTHSSGEANVADNITVLTGKAEYGKPEIQRILEVT
ncbi:MAG: metallophosphoesterase [Planctomycetota bacterium]